MGTTMREILEEHAGGMRDGLKFRGVIPGGASTDFLRRRASRRADGLPEVQKAGSRLGTGTMIVLDDQTCPVGMVSEPRTLLCAGVLRLVHAVLERLGLGGKDSASDGGRTRTDGRPGDTARFKRSFLAPGHTFCALAPGAIGTTAERTEIFPRGFRTAHS